MMNCYFNKLLIQKSSIQFSIMKDGDQSSIKIEQSASILEIWNTLKNSIFDVLFVLLDSSDGEETLFGLAFEVGVDYLQMMAFPFDKAVIEVWNAGETLQSITNIFNGLNISTYIPGIQFNTFLILLYSLILMILLVILDIIYVGYSFSKKKFRFTWPLVLLAKIVPLFVTVLFLPIMQTLLQVVNCESNSSGKQVLGTFPDIVCWEGWHLFHSVITLFFSSVFVFISCIVTLALFEPRMTSNRLTARQNSTGQVVFIINKIICQLFFSFSLFSTSLPYTLMLFFLSTWLYSTYNIAKPYYSGQAAKFFRIVSTYYFWTNFMLMVSQVLRPFNFKGGLVVWICGLLCISLGIIFQRKSNIQTLFSSNLKFKSGQQLQSHLQYVLMLLHKKNEDKNSYMLLLGYIQKHIQICTEDDCPLRMKNPSSASGKQQQDFACNQLLKQLERMFQHGIKKYPECTKLRLTFAFFYMERIDSRRKAYQHFTKASITQPTFGQQFIIYRFKKIIKQNLQKKAKDGDKTDLIEMIRFDNYVSLCQEGMLLSAQLHKQFWIQLQEESPDLHKLNNIGNHITQTLTIIKQNYDEVMKSVSNSPQLQYNYGFFQIFIMQQLQTGKILLQEAKKGYEQKFSQLIHDDDELNSYNEQMCMLVVSVESPKHFQISRVNNRFIQLVKYSNDELQNRQLHKIMPNFIKNVHDKFIQKWLTDVNQSTYLNSKREGYVRDRAGFMKKVSYKVQFIPETNKFIIEMIPVAQDQQINLIVDRHGKICDYNYRAYFHFRQYIRYNFQCIFSIHIKNLQIQQQNYVTLKYKENNYVCYGRKLIYSWNSNYLSLEGDQLQYNYALRIYLHNDKSLWKITKNKTAKLILLQQPHLREKQTILSKYHHQQQLKLSYEQVSPPYHIYDEKTQIKTIRFWKGKFQKLYFDLQTQSDYDFQEFMTDLEGQLCKQRLTQTHYQQKIKKSLNTNINHPQLIKLFTGSVFVAVAFISMMIGMYVILVQQIHHQASTISQLNNNTHNIYFIIQELTHPLMGSNSTKQYKINYQFLPSEDVPFPTQQLPKYLMNDGQLLINQININHGLTIIQSNIINHYYQPNITKLQISYNNYIHHIYHTLSHVSRLLYYDGQIYYILLIGGLGLLWVGASIFWIYTLLLVKRKIFQILLWFLQIPLDYVFFLQKKCIYFIKHYVGVKEIWERRLKLHEETHYIEPYDKTQTDSQVNGSSNRKLLINRYRKHSLMDRFKYRYLFIFFMVLVGCFYAVFLFTYKTIQKANLTQLIYNYQIQSRLLTWLQTLPLSVKILQQIQEGKLNSINYQQAQKVFSEVKGNLINMLTQYNLIQLFNELISRKDQISTQFMDVFYGNICNDRQCQELLHSCLQGGVFSYIQFVNHLTLNQLKSFLPSIYKAQVFYVGIRMISMLESWYKVMEGILASIKSIMQILLYFWVILSVFMYFVVWIYYIRRINLQLNRTMRMLKMIPMMLLKESRPQMRNFLNWIITQAIQK